MGLKSQLQVIGCGYVCDGDWVGRKGKGRLKRGQRGGTQREREGQRDGRKKQRGTVKERSGGFIQLKGLN